MINLREVELLQSLNDQEINFLESISQKRSLKNGEELFKIGEEATAFYILLDGKLEAYIPGEEEKILGEIKAEDIVGEMGLLSETKIRSASVRAIEDSILLVILPFAIEQLKDNHPEIIEKIKEIIEKRNRENELNNIILD